MSPVRRFRLMPRLRQISILAVLALVLTIATAATLHVRRANVAPDVDLSFREGRVSRPDLCLAIGLSSGSAYECGNLRISHALPPTRTKGKDRMPVLTYNSQHAKPFVLVPIHVGLPSNGTVPTKVTATLTAGSATATGTWTGSGWSAGVTRRVTLGFTPTAGTGVHSYSLEVTNWYGSTPLSRVVTGYYVVVDRSTSAFGAGWWLAGLESLDLSTMTLVDGGGGIRQYSSAGTGRWAALNVDRPDTIVQSGTSYVRKLGGGSQVVFNSLGQHITTRNPQGDSTRFTYSSGRLYQILLPAPSTSPQYTFTYTSGYLTSVSAPGSRTTTVGRSGAVVTSIQDPASAAVTFTSSNNRITGRTDRRGKLTSFAYNAQTWRLSQSTIDPSGLNIATGITAEEGLGHASGTTAVPSTALVDERTLLDGPRTGADQAYFWLDRFGAPRKIRAAGLGAGDTTSLTRGNATFPALVTSVVHPNGYRENSVYNARGNVEHHIRINPFARSPAQHDTTRYVYYANTDARADYAQRVVPQSKDSTVLSYLTNGNLEWQEDARGSVSRVLFRYYAGSNQLRAVQTPDGGVGPAVIDSIAYDAVLGNPSYQRTALGFVTTHHTDAIGRDTLVVSPMDVAQQLKNRTRYVYNARGLVETVITSGDAVQYTCFACVGTINKPVPAQELIVYNAYDADGNVTHVGRSGNPTTSSGIDFLGTNYTYDAANRKIAESSDVGQTFVYDKAGNVTQWVRNGRIMVMEYDDASRLTRKIIPEVFHASATCYSYFFSECPANLPPFDSLRIRPDTQTFAYDNRGNMLAAHNRYARVLRTYYPGGSLKTDTLRFRTYSGPDLPPFPTPPPCVPGTPGCPCIPDSPECIEPQFTGGTVMMMGLTGDPYPDSEYSTAYGITYTYDRNGRRASMEYPSQLRPSTTASVLYSYHPWGAPSQIVGLMGDTYTFGYHANGQLTSTGYPGITETYAYDLDGRRVRRMLGSFYNDTMTYDARGKVLTATARYGGGTNNYYRHIYSGLGHVVRSSRGDITDSNYYYLDEYRYDYHGNAVWSRERDHLGTDPQFSYAYDAGKGSIEEIRYDRSIPYSNPGLRDHVRKHVAGTMVFSADVVENTSQQVVASSPTRHYHGADGKLRAVKKFGWSGNSSGTSRVDLVQEIRYDALGRRIFQHTRPKPLCQINPCIEAFERYVWDGDQLLYELRSSSGSSQYSTGKQYGRTGYVHGPGIDAPLAIMRQDFQSSAAIRINPFANWRGQYERGNASGGWPLCTGSNGPNCISVAWPAPQARTFLDGVPAEAGDWVGSLIKDQRDASGLLYRRNRYYDPYTGQFTQEDPIGVAGGFNLYGFAGGDPISNSDPFGLTPCRGASALAYAGAAAVADGPVPAGEVFAVGCLLVAGTIGAAAMAESTWDAIKGAGKRINRWRKIVTAVIGGMTAGDEAGTREIPAKAPWEIQVPSEPLQPRPQDPDSSSTRPPTPEL